MNALFNDAVRLVLRLAQVEAERLRHGRIGTEHLLLAIAQFDGCLALRVLESAGIKRLAISEAVEKATPHWPEDMLPTRLFFSSEAHRAMALALDAAKRLGHPRINTGHLLLGLLEEADGIAYRVLVKLGIGRVGRNLSRVAERIIAEMKTGWPPVDAG